jgi:uncharacterized membrane protein
MIQRIQTVYLFFVFCLMGVLVFIPFSSSWTVTLDAAIIALLSVVAIFLYKHRKRQILIGNLILLLLVLAYPLHFIFDGIPADLLRTVRYTFAFPLVAAILVCLAIRGIKKDERLVRSADRLR